MDTRLFENIDWVGYVDWTIRDFHGYDAARGTTYNAYLIRDEKTALIDTVKDPYGEELLRNISALADPASVDYVICNHAEPDHAGALEWVMPKLPNATVVCNKKCVEALSRHFDTSAWKFHLVTTGDRLALGKRSLQFINTPMVHWPESMFTYVPEEKLLFSMDAFGQHLATSGRFDDEVPICAAYEEAKSYFANIVMPYGKQVVAVLEQLKDTEIRLVAPSHGVIWRSRVHTILEGYTDWSMHRPRPKVLVIYDSMWQSTARMARAIHEGAAGAGIDAVLINARSTSFSRIATETLDAACVALGSATLNRGMMPMMAATLNYLEGLRPSGKAGFAFGSYGWGKGASEAIDEYLNKMKWEITRPPLRAQYRPTPEILDECRRAGETLAQKAREMAPQPTTGDPVCIEP